MRPFFYEQTNQRKVLILVSLLTLVLWLVNASLPVLAQEGTPAAPTQSPPTVQPGAPVEVNGRVLFYVFERIGSISPVERAALISQRITNLATNPFSPPVEISLAESSDGTDVLADDQVILTVTDRDASSVGMSRQEAAERAAGIIQTTISTTREEFSLRATLVRAGESLLLLGLLIGILVLINKSYYYLVKLLDAYPADETGKRTKRGLLRSRSTIQVLKKILRVLRWVIIAIFLIFVVPLVLRIFPTTARFAVKITGLVLTPFAKLWEWVIKNQENFFTLGIIFLVTYLLIRLVRGFFKEVERKNLILRGFEPDWAPFTSRIVSFLLIVAAIVVAFPFVPGSDSEAFRGITIFLGALFTLSSTAAVSNIVAGVIQTYTGSFKVGEVVKIGMNTGIVTEKRLLTTRIRTFKNEEISIPNGAVLGAEVVNYSVMARGKGLVLYTTVTIGYDAPWKKVHELLISAALATPYVLETPRPFVLQTSLNDYNVSYQVNCFTRHPERMARIYSNLNANIQDKFNEAGVEIMSPAFMGVRDANEIAIPAEYRPEDYQAPRFRIDKE
jgi:small-conductance mechanosensitive channel